MSEGFVANGSLANASGYERRLQTEIDMPLSIMKRCCVLAALVSPGCFALHAEAEDGRPKRPNILFCISDDQSWLYTSIGGDPVVKTPAFDRVAREGLRSWNS